MIWVGYILFGVLLFILSIIFNNKYSISRRENIVFSLIYLLIISGVFSRIGVVSFNENIFMVVVVELFCQLFYINYFLEKDFFNKDDKNFSFYMIKIVLAFLLNQELINRVSSVFLSGEELKIIVWLLVIVYLYQFFKGKETTNNISKESAISKESIALSFAKLKLAYGDDISVSNESLKLIIYSIMIFNNYKRSKVFRKIDSILFRINNKPRKLGVMQVMSKKYINDYESIVLAIKKIEKIYSKNKDYIEVINLYDKNNSKEICYIYDELSKFCKL